MENSKNPGTLGESCDFLLGWLPGARVNLHDVCIFGGMSENPSLRCIEKARVGPY